MKHSYIANEKEAALFHSGQQTAIIVPMKVQPEKDYTIHKGKEKDGKEFFEERNGSIYKVPRIKQPYALH